MSVANLQVWVIIERTNLGSSVQSSGNKFRPLSIL